MKIKEYIKRNNLLMDIYKRTIQNIDKKILTIISPVYASKNIYKKVFKKELNLNEPKTYNEKLMWLKLYWRNSLKSKCADKYAVREYIIEKGQERCLNELYGVYKNSNEIIWDELPNSFVLKVNNTCGANIICNDKSKLDKNKTLKQLDKWMKDKFYLINAEIHYKDIKPLIICEKYLKPQNGLLPVDYKIYCFNGIPKVIMICTERETGNPKFYLCDLNGNILPFNETGKIAIKNGKLKLQLPETVKEMYEISQVLSNDFPFVRMDFYDHDGKVIFGEMTFTPAACLDNKITEEGENIMGDWMKLPERLM